MSLPWIAPIDDPALVPQVARYTASLAVLPARQRRAGKRLLVNISTTNWFVEWNLPRWLGRTLALSPHDTDELVLGNVFGLAYVRLQDNLFDGDQAGGMEEATALASSLYRHWIGQYRLLFASSSPFWEYLDRFCGQWLRASLEMGGPNGDELRSGSAEPVLRLAERGAPLKICCAAAYLLAGREAVDPGLLAGISYLLSGAVLIDHADDWQADLIAGRYNALAAFVSPGAGDVQADRQAILEELYLGSAERSYFELAQHQFRRARDYVHGLGVDELEDYLTRAEAETAAYSDKLADMKKFQLQKATAELLRSI